MILEARLEALASDDKTEDKEYKECLFINGAPQKGLARVRYRDARDEVVQILKESLCFNDRV